VPVWNSWRGTSCQAWSPEGDTMAAADGATGITIDGFRCIGRQAACVTMKDPELELKFVNPSYDAEYLAYQMKRYSIHGRYDGDTEADGDSLVIDGHRVVLSHMRDSTEIPFMKHRAEYVYECMGMFVRTEKTQPCLRRT